MLPEFKILENIAERTAGSKLGNFVEGVRTGWNNYNFIFYIGGISAILGGLFGWAGWASIVITLLFFYYAGKFKEKVDIARKRRKALIKSRKSAKPAK